MDRSKHGQAPYGFSWSGGRLCLHDEEAATRRMAFEMFVKSGSMGAVARDLNAAGRTTRRGKQWSDVQAARILECPSAVGRYETNRSAEDGTGKRRRTAAEDRDVVECEPIVTRELWDRVATLLRAQRAKRQTVREEPAPLTGHVWCHCGQRMQQASKSANFECPKCDTRISAADLEAIFAEDFRAMIASHPSLMAALESSSVNREQKATLASLEHELKDAVKQRAGIERMFTEKAIPQPRFEELHAPEDKRVRQLEARIAALREELHGGDSGASPDAAGWKAVWDSWPESRRGQIIHTFVDAFIIGVDEIEVRYLLPEPSASKETSQPRQTDPPTNQRQSGDPVYIRLPAPGSRCPYSGLSRAKLNELILPNTRNHFNPPVASKSLRQEGSQRGIRLVLLESLLSYLAGKS